MLLEIKIENFALAKDIEIAFRKGFNVMTGESGAGKSLIIESLNFVLGGKVKTAKLIGDKTARVQAVFDMPKLDSEIMDMLKSCGIVDEDDASIDDTLILMRKLNSSGRNQYSINGAIVTFGSYRDIGQALVDIHGQRDSQFLLDSQNQRRMLDMAAGKEAEIKLAELESLHSEIKDITGKIDNLSKMERDRKRNIDWVSHEIMEIEEASLSAGEDEELKKQKNILSNAEKISNLAGSVYEVLSGEHGVLKALGNSTKDLTKWCEYDPDIEKYVEIVDGAVSALGDVASEVRDKGESIDFDAAKLDKLIVRLHQIDTLKQKYGATIEDILGYLEESKKKLAELERSTQHMEELLKVQSELVSKWNCAALELSALRKKTSQKIEKEASGELEDLGLKGAGFRVDISGSSEGNRSGEKENRAFITSPHGFDKVEFMIKTNPGMPEMPLSMVASGGELSRVMLALKNIFARFRGFSTLILDEIDVGLGGITAESVGRKLQEIAKHRQVICVTHLPIVAAMADYHYQIEKTIEDGSTKTILTSISGDDRIDEVVRMIAGESAAGEARKVAEKLLKGKN